jgi:ABC-2 type transport system permease protein
VTPIIEILRGLLTGAPVGASVWWAIGWCLLILTVSYLTGSWLFQRRTWR